MRFFVHQESAREASDVQSEKQEERNMRKKARIWKSIALVMAAAMALTACSGGITDTSGTSEASGTEAAGTEGGTYKDTLHIAVTQQSPSLDLHKNSTLIARQMCDGTVWEKLVT